MPRRQTVFSAIIALGATVSMLPAHAAEVDVQVSADGKDATDARTKALAKGEKLAFDQLTAERAPDRASELSASISAQQISSMIQGFEVVKEAMTANSYRATLRYDFSDAAVDGLVGAKSFAPPPVKAEPVAEPVSDVAAPPPVEGDVTLVIPLFKSPEGVQLWEPNNPWRKAINETVLEQSDGKAVTAYGDPRDALIIDAENAAGISYSNLKPVAERYGANKIIVALAEPVETKDPNELPYIDLLLRRLTPKGASNKRLQVKSKERLTLPAALASAAEEIVGDLSGRNLPNAYAPGTPEKHSQQAKLNTTSARDWADLQARLANIAAVTDTQLVNADWESVIFTLNFQGSPDVVQRELQGAGIRVAANESMWVMTLR